MRLLLATMLVCCASAVVYADPVIPETKLVTSVSELRDVSNKHKAYSAIRSLVERRGVLSADEKGNFRPDELMRRGAFAVWLNTSLSQITEIKLSMDDMLASLEEKDRADFIKSLHPLININQDYTSAQLADIKTFENDWYAKAIVSLEDRHKAGFALNLKSGRCARPEELMTRDEVRRLLGETLQTSNELLDTIEKNYSGDVATRFGRMTRAEAAVTLDEAIADCLERMSRRIESRLSDRAVELARELKTRFDIQLLDDDVKALNKSGAQYANRGLLLDVTYHALVCAQKRLQAAMKTPGLPPAKQQRLAELYPGKYSEFPGIVARPGEAAVSDLKPGDLRLGLLAYLDSNGVFLRARAPDADPKKPPLFGPDRQIDVARIRKLMAAVFHDDVKDQSKAENATAAMTLRRFRDALDRFDAKIKAIVE